MLPHRLLSLLFVSAARAFPGAINWTIQADAPTRVAFNLTGDGMGQFDAIGKPWNYLRLLLEMSPNCYDYEKDNCLVGAPVCVLLGCVALNVTGLTLQQGIPANVGPSGQYYGLSWVLTRTPYGTHDEEVKNDNQISGNHYGNSMYHSTLLGGTGVWTEYETTGHAMWDYPVTPPCRAYDCARKCATSVGLESGTASWFRNATMDACMQKCDGFDHVDPCVIENDTSFDAQAFAKEVDDGLNNGGYVDPREATRTPATQSAPTTTTAAEAPPPDSASRATLSRLLLAAVWAWMWIGYPTRL